MKSACRSTRRNSKKIDRSTTTTTTERKDNNDKAISPSIGEATVPHSVKYTDHTALKGPSNKLESSSQHNNELKDDRASMANPQQQRQLRQQQRRKVQFDSLHQEMELVSYSISETGQSRRVMPRHLSIERTKKRRLLEKEERNTEINSNNDDSNMGLVESNAHRKIRGPKAAAEDHVVEASLVFGVKPALKPDDISDESTDEADGDDEIENDDDGDCRDTEEPIDEVEDGEGGSDNDSNEDEEDIVLEPTEEVDDVDQAELFDLESSKSIQKKKRNSASMKFSNSKRKKTSRLQRLKNFKSTRMAEKHGAALGAHVQGKSDVAIRKLKQIAASVPLAPQIYSSLGMVYEDLLQESQQKGVVENINEKDDDSNVQETMTMGALKHSLVDHDLFMRRSHITDNADTLQTMIHDKSLRDQLNLAKKAYGSYHVAAILYKRDFSLWLRAADSAYEIANVHTTIMKLPDITENIIEYHRAEKIFWLSEAKNDYQAADNLHPPGIEIPAKLAHVMIELGMLSEALTLLTGLKNQAEFNGSYRAWLLFADLMLRIGHECNQWNAGIQSNNNKMFRRWLRKLSTSFDWKERRMQALIKSLEAACGTACCRELMTWIQIRVADTVTEENESHLTDTVPANSNELPNNHPIPSNSGKENTIEEHPLTASFFTVCSIASELMRQMLDMQLHFGGKLVGDSVSLYLKQRQTMCTDRRRKKEEFDSMQKRPISLFAMQPESYDVDDDSGSDADNDVPISDDEDWDGDVVTPALRQGTLPPELRFLYGLCLSDDSGKVPLAAACIQSLNMLPIENVEFFKETVIDCGVVQDSAWTIFHETMTQPFGRITALCLVTDEVRRCPLEAELQKYLITLYDQSTTSFYDEGWLDFIEHNASIVSSHRCEQLIKVLIAAERYKLILDTRSDDTLVSSESNSLTILSSFTKLSKLISTGWKVHHKGSIESYCVDAITAISGFLKLYNDRISKNGSFNNEADCENVLHHLFNIFSTICGNVAINEEESNDEQLFDLTVIPMKSSWLTNDLESLSTKAFNLCVGMNISNFSGWQMEKYTLKSRSIVGYCSFFGVTTDEGPMSGYIPELLEREICKNWDLLHELYPGKVTSDLKRKLGLLTVSDWYKDTRLKYHTHEENHQIFEFGEDRGLLAMLDFANICLTYGDKRSNRNKLHAVALSILLPVTQFVLKEKLWDANLGNNSLNEGSDIQEWLDTSKAINNDCAVAPSQRPGYIRPSKRQLPLTSNSDGETPLIEWFKWEDGQHPKLNLINIPLCTLAEAWNQTSDHADSEADLAANEIMKDVDNCIAKLRLCCTIQAAEQLSVVIASTLLKLLEYPLCGNPFAVLQLATIYASQGPKGGSSDHLFRARLPKAEECTCQDALLILGRAECMNALHFCPEAAFLCSYVVNVCRLNCDGIAVLRVTNRRWLVLSILAYDLSIVIRTMAKSILRNSNKREDAIGSWADVVVDWFRQIRHINQLTERLLANDHHKSDIVAIATANTSTNEGSKI